MNPIERYKSISLDRARESHVCAENAIQVEWQQTKETYLTEDANGRRKGRREGGRARGRRRARGRGGVGGGRRGGGGQVQLIRGHSKRGGGEKKI